MYRFNVLCVFSVLVMSSSVFGQSGGGFLYRGWYNSGLPEGARACGSLGGVLGQNTAPCGSVAGPVATANPYPLIKNHPSTAYPLGLLHFYLSYPEASGVPAASETAQIRVNYRSTVPNYANNFSAPEPPQTISLDLGTFSCTLTGDRPCPVDLENRGGPFLYIPSSAIPGVIQIAMHQGQRSWYQCVDLQNYNASAPVPTSDPCLAGQAYFPNGIPGNPATAPAASGGSAAQNATTMASGGPMQIKEIPLALLLGLGWFAAALTA